VVIFNLCAVLFSYLRLPTSNDNILNCVFRLHHLVYICLMIIKVTCLLKPRVGR